MNGLKLLLVEICIDEMEDVRYFIVVVDNVGVGNGDFVFVIIGSVVWVFIGDNMILVDVCIVGIIDLVECYGWIVFRYFWI